MNYENLTAEEMRKLLLEDKLCADYMTENKYEELFGYESEFDDPNAKVLNFCVSGLNQYEKYNRDIPKTPIEELFKEAERRNRKMVGFRVLKRTSIAAVVFIITILLTQIVSLAFGFDFFGYIFNWNNKDSVEIVNNSVTTDNLNNDNEEDIIDIEYSRITDIEWINLISPYIIENYIFDYANYSKFFEQKSFTIRVVNDYNNFIIVNIENSVLTYVEKNDNTKVEEIEIDGINFSLFENMEDNQIIWIYDGFLYTIRTDLPIETVKEIINNYY